MAGVIEDLRQDVAELEELLQHATRQKVKDILTLEMRKLQTDITLKQGKLDKAATPSDTPSEPPAKNVPSATRRYTKEITTYAWDQSDKFMKIYVTLDGVQDIPRENVTVECKERCIVHQFDDRLEWHSNRLQNFQINSFKLQVKDWNDKDCVLHVVYLFDKILPADSYCKVKKDCVLIMLKKVVVGRTWAYVIKQETKEKKRPKMDESKDPSDGLMDLLKNMYEDGDDEMKKTISKAWAESQSKAPADLP